MHLLGKLLTTAGLAAVLTPAAAQLGPIALPIATDVNVTNTPAVTVANTPSVTVANTPNVNVANTPNVAVTNNPGVTVTNTPNVTVSNPVTSPVPVLEVGQATIQPVNGACAALYGTVTNLKQCELYTVPAGKRLVVETVVYQLAIEAGNFPYGVTYQSSGGTGFYTFAPTLVGNDGLNHYANASPTRIYLGPGETFSVYTQFSAATIYGQRYSFSGYLTNQ